MMYCRPGFIGDCCYMFLRVGSLVVSAHALPTNCWLYRGGGNHPRKFICLEIFHRSSEKPQLPRVNIMKVPTAVILVALSQLPLI